MKVLSPLILPVVTDLLIFYFGEVESLVPGVVDYSYAPIFTWTTFRRDSNIDSPTLALHIWYIICAVYG